MCVDKRVREPTEHKLSAWISERSTSPHRNAMTAPPRQGTGHASIEIYICDIEQPTCTHACPFKVLCDTVLYVCAIYQAIYCNLQCIMYVLYVSSKNRQHSRIEAIEVHVVAISSGCLSHGNQRDQHQPDVR